jgi:acyl-coenzyme A thioesterase PaaI-like protein
VSEMSPNQTFESRLSLSYDRVTSDEVSGHVDVTEDLRNSCDLVPLAVYAAIAESAAWTGTAAALEEMGLAALSLENSTTLTAEVHDGRISVLAGRLGSTSDYWTWNVQFRDDADEMCATSIVVVAVRRPCAPPD